MAKRKKKKTQKGSKFLNYVAWFLAVVAMILVSFVAGYYIGQEDGISQVKHEVHAQKKKNIALLKKLEKATQIPVQKRLQAVLKKEQPTYKTAAHEFDTPLAKPPKPPKRKIVHTSSKPKLAIIIDDVGTKSQVRAIKSVGIPLTMSFLPPSSARPNTPKLASHEQFYMVHLPMEAMHWSAEEPNTLRINDSQSQIIQRIQKIKQLFPKVHYINNHTGSKFTSNEVAMNRLIVALNKYNISFIDSRTTAQTKAPIVMKNFGLRYVARDVFLDHHMEESYVLKQIQQAIKTAKLHGTAIAIGHPHPNTLAALKKSKALLKDVDVVYIYQLY